MLGLWLENNNFSLRNDLPIPQPKAGEALIRVLMAGICNTDIELINGYYPYAGVLGHEFVGWIEQGPAKLIGKRVVGEINVVCGKCEYCLSGLKNHCSNRTVLGIVNQQGAFCEYLILPTQNLHIVPDEIATPDATFIEPLAAALEIQQQLNICPDDRVLVIGDGKLGFLITQTLLLTGCELWLVGHHAEKYQSFAKRGVIVGNEAILKPNYYNIVIECTGNESGFNCAINAVKPRGTIVMKSTYAGKLTINAAPIVVNEITIMGSRCGPMPPALRLLAQQQLEVKSFIEAIYPLHDAVNAVKHATRPGARKILLECHVL